MALVPIAAIVVALGFSGRDSTSGTVRFTVDGREQIGIPARPGRPLLVLLHGRGDGPDSLLRLHLVEALHALGPRAPNLMLANGAPASYFHDRRDFAWGRYVLRDVIPAAVRRLHADPRRVEIGGISMGGFGALDLARIAPRRFCAVGAHSAALWFRGADTPAGAFDDTADFARNDVVHLPFRYRGPLWLDVGTRDPFRAADTAFAQHIQARLRVWQGAHEGGYWRAHLAAYLAFYVQSCP